MASTEKAYLSAMRPCGYSMAWELTGTSHHAPVTMRSLSECPFSILSPIIVAFFTF